MKTFALILSLFIVGFARGQITYTPMSAGGYQFKYNKSDSGQALPFRNLSTGRGTARPGSIVCNTADSLLYYWNGVIWVKIAALGGSGGTFIGIDSVTYAGNSFCQWKGGIPTCYSVIPGVDSVTVHNNEICQWKGGVSTCDSIRGTVVGTGLDSVTVIGNLLCEWKAGNSTCFTINNPSTGIDSLTVTDSLLCSWQGGQPTCFIMWTKDTVRVKDDLTVSFNAQGEQVLGREHSDGLVSGGIVTSAGCLSLQVTSANYYLNHGINYVTAVTTLTVPTPDPSLPRTDAIILDTFGVVKIRAGTPAASPTPPSYNPASEWLLATYPVGAGATCLNINTIVIYDENTEYTHSTSGSITDNPNNTDNPQHLTKADFVSTYGDAAKITWTKGSGTDTVYNNSVFKWFLFLNNPFTNTMSMQLFNGAASVSNNIVVNSYFNTVDTLVYQPVGVPAYAFNSPGGNIVFNKVVFTLAGNDLSGASGFYLDYLQLQTGITNPNNTSFPFTLTTNGNNGSSTWDNVGHILNVPTYITWWSDSNYNNIPGRFIRIGRGDPSYGSLGNGSTSYGFQSFFDTPGGGTNNTAIGTNSQYHNNGYNNTSLGDYSMWFGALGHDNLALGHQALANVLGNESFAIGLGTNSEAFTKTLFISDSTTHFHQKLDSAAGTAPNVIGKDVSGNWHVYQNSGGGGSGGLQHVVGQYGLTQVNDSTLKVDSAALSLKYLRIVDTANIRFRPVAGSNITLTGTYPNITIAASAPGTGTVTNVTGTSPINVATGTTTPVVSLGTVPIANGGTNNGSLPVTAGTMYYGDGTKLIGLAPGTTKQHLTGGTTPAWKDTLAAGNINTDTIPLFAFGAGGNNALDTTAFTTSTIYGSFYNFGSDTMVITKLQIGLQGSGGSPSIVVDIYWNDSLNITAGATKLVNAGTTATNLYTGTSVTSFDSQKIPPGVWVWCKTTTLTVKPQFMAATLIGYKIKSL